MSEHNEQASLFVWAEFSPYKHLFNRLLFSIPNESGGGTKGDMLRGLKKKREGRKAGTSDIMFAYPQIIQNHDETLFFPGLFIEMKDYKKYLDPDQKAFINSVREQGYLAFGVQGWPLAKLLLVTYIENVEKLFALPKEKLYFKGFDT